MEGQDSVDGVQLSIDAFMLQMFEASRAYQLTVKKDETETHESSSGSFTSPQPQAAAQKVKTAYQSIVDAVMSLEDGEVSREQQEQSMRSLQRQQETLASETLAAEKQLLDISARLDASIVQVNCLSSRF